MKLGAAKTTKDASLPPQVGCRQRAKNSKTGGKHTAGYEYKVIVSLFGRTEPTLRILENIKTLLLQTYVIVFAMALCRKTAWEVNCVEGYYRVIREAQSCARYVHACCGIADEGQAIFVQS